MPQIPFVGAAYRERSVVFDAQRCVNLYPVMQESGTAKSVAALYGTPGSRRVATCAAARAVRALYTPTDGSNALVVCANTLYRMDSSYNLTEVGALGEVDYSLSPMSIKDDGTLAVIVNGSRGWTLKLSDDTLTEITDEAFYGSDKVDVLDGYFIFNRPDTNVFYIARTEDGALTFDALEFASAESNAEPIISFIVTHNQIVFLKKTVTEIWGDSGNPDFPFARDRNAAIEQGCAAPWSLCLMDNTIFWLGSAKEGAGRVWRLNGYTPVPVSTEALEYAIATYGDVSDAIAYAYQQEGHNFYVLTFPSANATWVYDANTRLWHERAYLDPVSGELQRHRSNCYTFFNNQHVIGDFEDGRIYLLDLDYYTDDGDYIKSLRAASHIADGDYVRIPHKRLQVDMEVGIGLQSGQGSDPQACLDWSDDGGRTWSNEHWANIGMVGAYRARVYWNRLGMARDRVYRLTITDPVKRVILGASLNPELR